MKTEREGRFGIAQQEPVTWSSRPEAWAGDIIEDLRARLKKAESRAAYLAEAGRILAASALDVDSTIQALARLAVSRLADWCVVFELEDGGAIVRRQLAHRDPERELQLAQLTGTRVDEGAAGVLQRVMRRGRAEIINDVPGPFARGLITVKERSAHQPPEAVERLMIIPLRARGQSLGALALVSSDPLCLYEDEELSLAEELAGRAAIAMDNARLYQQSQEANRAKADFLAIVSHELRTPLNAIMGYSDLLDSGISGPVSVKQRRHLGRIRASARHLRQLIEEMLSFVGLERGDEVAQVQPVRAIDLAREAAAVVEPLIATKGLALDMMEVGEPVTLHTDVAKARQVLVNLLSNAVKFTANGCIELVVSRRDDVAEFTIRDNGPGIPPEKLHRVFEPFWQADHPNTRCGGGMGMGLSVSRRFARMLNGDVVVDSTPGVGTTVTVRLPLGESG